MTRGRKRVQMDRRQPPHMRGRRQPSHWRHRRRHHRHRRLRPSMPIRGRREQGTGTPFRRPRAPNRRVRIAEPEMQRERIHRRQQQLG